MTAITTDEKDRLDFDWQTTKRLAHYLTPNKTRIYWALFASLISAVANVVGPPIIGWAVDQGVHTQNLSVVGLGVFGYLATQGIGALAFRIQITLMAQAGQRAIQDLRDDLFSHIQHLSISFFAKYETGRLIARIINDVNTLREAITWAVVGTFRDLLSLIGVVITMLLINLPLTFVAFAVLVVLAFVANVWRVYARTTYLRVVETNSKLNAELAEAFNGVRVTQAFNRQAHNLDRFNTTFNERNRAANLRATLVASLFFPSIELIGGVATGLMIYVGGTLVLQQQLSIFTLLTFVLYIDQFFQPIRQLAQRYNLFQSVMAAGDKLFHLLDRPIEISDQPGADTLPRITGAVQFDHVNFRYDTEDEDAPVLHDVSLDVPAGTTVALVGHTGAGKSTMIKLIMRFHDVVDGTVKIDGVDVRNVAQTSLRSQMGVVLQETYLFSGTVMDNIRYGRLNATDEEVIEAAQAVGAHDFISALEKGYHTEVREGGSLLSQGQKQLLAFARALLADPRILILDEATSNIDTQTEKLIQTALARLLEGRTSFVIAHRLSTIVNSDLIVVMDHGRIIEQGSHLELLAKNGAYAGMYTMI
ncbi:MAG: ABC transporter ATP-binding protein [Chloroflexi bacterium]|uniref:ABC transporter ATP-binding protein n=1 Tax=Candidatus Flexifilum breve TaxID=3140694 RepID=UPI003136C49E|nr:ABC transporter ATP-binding protein [Chloroflexota bacterium]